MGDERNPYPPGTMLAEWWEAERAVRALGAALWARLRPLLERLRWPR